MLTFIGRFGSFFGGYIFRLIFRFVVFFRLGFFNLFGLSGFGRRSAGAFNLLWLLFRKRLFIFRRGFGGTLSLDARREFGRRWALLPSWIPVEAVTTTESYVLKLLFECHPVVRLTLLADQGEPIGGSVSNEVLHHPVHIAALPGENGPRQRWA